jgi:2-polyprenyl-3-methyl-5-hydroxy-6-metoxy-1,4-benzoquinol methylase
MAAVLFHVSKYLLVGAVDEASFISVAGGAPEVLRAFPEVGGTQRKFYFFNRDGFVSGTEVFIWPADSGESAGQRFAINLIPGTEKEWQQLLCTGLNGAPDWTVDNIDVSGDEVSFSGWVLLEPGRTVDVQVNDAHATISLYHRPDIDTVFNYLSPYRRWSGFSGQSRCDPLANELRLRLVDSKAVVFSYSMATNRSFPFPEPDRIHRVNGAVSLSAFNRAGYSNYKIIADICRRLCNGRRDPISVLDWGCGCGGLSRYFLLDSDFDYLGCDIDRDNLLWCNENLKADTFFLMSVDPPETSPFGRRFDVIFGVSVISHQRPSDMKRWLNWLASQLTPGGSLVLSTLSIQALSKLPSPHAHTIVAEGYGFSQQDSEIGRIIGNQDYYGVSYQTPTFLADLIEPLGLEIAFHHPGALGHQDIFVISRQ